MENEVMRPSVRRTRSRRLRKPKPEAAVLGEPDFCFTELGCLCALDSAERLWALDSAEPPVGAQQLNGIYRPRPSAPETFSIQLCPCSQTTDRHRPSVSAVCTVLVLHSQCAAPTIQQSNNPTMPVQQCMVHQSATIGGRRKGGTQIGCTAPQGAARVAPRPWVGPDRQPACRARPKVALESEREQGLAWATYRVPEQ